ncbi:MAG: hypothetical protein PCFJNLEI_01438 [Verrucomicrobiae bacterium]|nr:hypothetical protein [Verrucomicrobiae bacterium]
MLATDELDEAWRVMKMFEDDRFNFRLADFPAECRQHSAGERAKSYRDLLRQVEELAGTFAVVKIGSAHGHELVKLVSRSPAEAIPVCLVAGIHGDEQDGILAALDFGRRFVQDTYRLTIYPCVNPTGYERMTRENVNGKDLNREFFRASGEEEVRIMERELSSQEFIGFIGGHSDYESFGLYAYATGAVLSERLAKPALFQASGIIPINTDPVIDGHPATDGIIQEKFPGSLGPLTKGTMEPFEITIETPNLFALRKRVEAQALAFETILQEYRAVSSEAMYL